MERDIKDVIGILMRALDGGDVSLRTWTISHRGRRLLVTAVNEAYVKPREFANDRDLRLNFVRSTDAASHLRLSAQS